MSATARDSGTPALTAKARRSAERSATQILGDLVAQEPVLHPVHHEEVLEGAPRAVADPVLRLPEATRAVIDGHFEDAEAAHLEQGGDEAMESLVEDEIAQALAPEGAEGAAAVLDGLVTQGVADPIRHPGRRPP